MEEMIGLNFFPSAGMGMGIWFEIAIFAGTFIIALVLKKYAEAEKHRNAMKKKGFPQEATKVPKSPSKAENVEGLKYRQGPDSSGKRKAQVFVVSESSKDSLRLFDDVCSAKNPSMAVEFYEEMTTTGLASGLKAFEKHSRHTAQDFFNGLVQCAVRQGKQALVERFIIDMREADVPRTRAFYEGAMKMLAGKRLYHEALAVYSQLEKDGMEPSAVTYSCLVNFAVEVNELDLAMKFFEKLSALQTPSIRAYMTILRAFSKRQDGTNSIRILNDMQQRNLQPDSLVVNIVLATCVNADLLDQAESLLEEMQGRDPPVVDVVSYNTVIKGHAQKGHMKKALNCLEKMPAHGLKPNMITFNTVMDSAVRCKQPAQAWRVLSVMRDAGHRPDKYTCSILVKGLHDGASEEQIKECFSLLQTLCNDKASEENRQLFEVLFLSLLEASIKAKDLKIAMEIYGELKHIGIALSPQAYNGLVRALAAGEELAKCLGVWEEMVSAGVTPHSSTFEALAQIIKDSGSNLNEVLERISACNQSTVGSLIRVLCRGRRTDLGDRPYRDLALNVYNSMKNCKCSMQLDLATYISLIQAQCESSGGVEAASKIAEDAIFAGLKPDELLMNALLSGCFKEANVNLGKRMFEELTAAGAVPNQATYATMIKLYGRCQQLSDALSVVSSMEATGGLEPTTQTYSCLVHACIRNKQTSQALEVFQKMKQRKVNVLDSNLFSTLINGCASAYNIASGVQLIDEAFNNKVEISAETIENLISAASRKHTPTNLSKLQDIVQQYNVSIKDSARRQLFASRA